MGDLIWEQKRYLTTEDLLAKEKKDTKTMMITAKEKEDKKDNTTKAYLHDD